MSGRNIMGFDGTVFVDSFATSLSGLPVKDKKDPHKVFDTITANGRFCCFDVDDHLAGPVTMLFERRYIENTGGRYPWTKVRATPEGWLWRHGRPPAGKEGR